MCPLVSCNYLIHSFKLILPSSYARYVGLWQGAQRSSSPYKWVYKAMIIHDNENRSHNMVRYFRLYKLQDADIVARKMEGSMAQTPGPRHEPSASSVSCPQRKRITTADLMQGARAIIVLHQGEEYLLRITKSGKLILTK